ncbi:MAG TPA: glycosyltransferase family 39 protein [Pyrinomonadaceae bacterium]
MRETATDDRANAPRRAPVGARRRVVARGAEILCALLLAAMALNMLAVIRYRKGITTDEILMIPAGYYQLLTTEFRLVNEHPPLSKLVAGLPLLFLRPKALDHAPAPDKQWDCVVTFWAENRADFGRISFWARVPMIALAVALGVLLFAFARDLFGPRAAVVAVALFTLEPTVLAHGRVVQTDVPAAFGYLLLFYTLRRYALAPTWRRALLTGLAAGLGVVAKFSMLLAAPVLAAAFVALLWRAPRDGRTRTALTGHACVAALALLFVVHAAYSFDLRPLAGPDVHLIGLLYPENVAPVARAVAALARVLPADFVLGVLWQIHHNAEGHPASLLGMYSRTGWWYYFPVAFALKTTLPFLLLSLTSLAWAGRELFAKRDARFLWLLAPVAVYTAFVMTSRINIGVRYMLPAYPFLFALSGALLERLARAPRLRRAGLALAAALLAWHGFEAARAYPDYVPYMNQLASGRPHWRLLSDSNVEWGDDVRGMADYLKARGETRVRGALLGGFLTPPYYGLDYADMTVLSDDRLPHTRYVAVGASYLNGSSAEMAKPAGRTFTDAEMINFFDAYRRREPEAVIGGSIYLFREGE